MKVAFLVPAYNVRPWPQSFVARLNECFAALRQHRGLSAVLIFVDDGSTAEGTGLEAHRATLTQLDAQVIAGRHGINRGQGAALQTALEIARSPEVAADYFCTFDSDGQHDPADVERMLAKLDQDQLDIVFGNRFQADAAVVRRIPIARRLILRAAVAFERLLTGLDCGDAHNGLRVFGKRAAQVINLHQDRMAHATEFKLIVRREKLRYGELPVTITYTAERQKAGQHNADAARIFVDLVEAWWLQ